MSNPDDTQKTFEEMFRPLFEELREKIQKLSIKPEEIKELKAEIDRLFP